MTIQEAIKSGKPFYRSVWAKEYDDGYQPVYDAFKDNMKEELPGLNVGDILAGDWQVKLNKSGKELMNELNK